MNVMRQIMIIVVILLVAGWVKEPWEQRMQRDFVAAGCLDPKLALGVKEKIGQTCAAVALGGLRSVVATFLHLAAFGSFEDRNWAKLCDQFDLIVALQPRTPYYWDVGAWHMAYNAAVDYREREEMPASRREALHRSFVLKGRAFLERGVANNPEDWTLLSSLGRFYGNPTKFPDYEKSAQAYEKAWKTGKARHFEARAWLYSLARAENRQLEALELARELFQRPGNRVDSLCCLLFVLEWSQPGAPPLESLISQCFPDHQQALRMLRTYAANNADELPTLGVDHALQWLNRKLPAPEE